MLTKIQIANRGEQPQSGAAAKLNCMVRAARAGDFTPMEKAYV